MPAGVTSVDVQCWGEGGNGDAGNGGTSHSGGAGGGGGEFAENTTLAVASGGTAAFAIGAGGSGVNTTFAGSSVTVTAHAGGSGSGLTAGSGGSGSTAPIHFSGAAGGTSATTTNNITIEGGGGGGSSAGTGAGGGAGGNGGANSAGAAGTAPSGGGNGGGGSATAGVDGSAGSAPGGGGGGGEGAHAGSSSGGAGGGGQIVITYTASATHTGTATLTGSGTLQATGAFAGKAGLAGSGTLAWSGSRVLKATALSGTGTLTGTRIGILSEAGALSGSGTLTAGTAHVHLITGGAAYTATYGATYTGGPGGGPALSGTGTLTVSGVTLGFQAVLSGTGTLSIIGTGGTVQAAAGTSTPYAYPGTSQVAVAPPGTAQWQYLGTLGTVTALTYSFTCPGGADQLTCTVMIPASYRTQMLNPGWQVRVTRGGHVCWSGKLDEPIPTAQGWTLSAVGDGNRGTDFRAVYSGTWPAGLPDAAVNGAISRGLPWANPGIGTPAGMWLGQAQDSGSMTVTDLLNLVCTRGGLTWYASSQPGGLIGTDLSVFPLPTAVNRLLIVTSPVARTLGGDINTIWIRYEIDDGVAAGTSATFGTVSVQNAQSAAAHGVIETNMDLSSAGVMSAGAAQAVGNNVLAVYQRASFAGPFQASYGQLLNAGGTPIDPGTDQAGTVVRLILTDWGAGGEVSPAPITFIVGGYEWDDFAQKATITPYQMLDQSLSGLLSEQSTVLTPITVA